MVNEDISSPPTMLDFSGMSRKTALPHTLFSRSRELLGLAAKIGGKEIGQRINTLAASNESVLKLKTQIEQGKLLVESLGKLKGAAMKVGQLLSIEAADFLPKEVVQALRSLQNEAPPLPFDEIEKILRKEWGEARWNDLESIDREPLAAASIGQVHRARWRGQDLALKIQYPGVAESIDTDLVLLRKVSSLFLALSRRPIDTRELFNELSRVLKQEVNYTQEADAVEEYAKLIETHETSFVIPKICRDLVSPRVLAMSFESGVPFGKWIESSPPESERLKVAKSMLDLYSFEFFDLGLVQSDPNFANFLYRAETQQVVLLDFGATRRYTPEFRAEYRQLLRDIRDGAHEAILSRAFSMELIQKRESEECQEAFLKMLEVSIAPFDPTLQPFDFASVNYAELVRDCTLDFTRQVRYSAPPHQLIFLHRKLGGIFNMLKALKVSVDLRPYWTTLVEEKKLT